MMMNDFGVPMNDAELSMHKNPGKVIVQQQIATSGRESQIIWQAVGAAVNFVGSIIGGNKASNAARQQAQSQNEATNRQLEYDTDLWNMTKEKIVADREHATKVVETQAANELKLASWKDAGNAAKYNYDLMIRNKEQDSLDAQFAKSNDIYTKQIGFNDLNAKTARDSELKKLEEIEAETKFDSEEAYIQMLQAKGKMASIGSSGRSADKGFTSTLADYGRQVKLFNKSLASATGATKSVLKEIEQDRSSADLAAYGAKMLDPGKLPDPIQPLPTPVSNFLYPRDIGEYDFGPAPQAGAYASPSAAANMAWGAVIPGIASAAGAGLSLFD
tara:strand:+ start:343 stop:1335 length:993 start_codon:yes stop_codon:yes gene_type:complete